MKITDFSLENRVSVFVMMFIIIIMGYYSYVTLPKESAPDITIPLIVVSVPYFGVSPEDMENLVTRPIERELKGLSDVKEIRSTSQEGFTTITVEFVAGTDIDNALQKVREKVDLAKPDLPQDAEDPILTEINFSDLPIMILNVSGKMDLVGLKKIAEELEDEIETVPGVLDAAVTGGLTREVQVNIDPDRLRYYDLSVNDVVDAVRNEHLNIPGGTLDLGNTKYLVRVPGEFKVPERLKDIVIKADKGGPVYIRDLAEVAYSFKERDTISRLDGAETVSVSVTKRTGTNLLEIADRVKGLVDKLELKLPPGISIQITGDQSIDIRQMVDELENSVISGLLLVVAVLMVAMGARNAFLVAISMPLSMLLGFLVFYLMDQSINMVVLFSLIMVVGMVVDDAIVIVENIYRHHQEGLELIEAAGTATREVGMAVTSSTVTTLCAFFPLMMWPGIVGEFMYYLPLTVIITLTASLFVALVFNPTVCSRLMKITGPIHKIEARPEKLGPVMRRYYYLLCYAVNRPKSTLGLSLALLAVITILYGFFGHGVEFFPEADPRKIYVDITAPSGTNLQTSDDLARQVEELIERLPDVKHRVANVGHQGADINFSFGGGETNKSRIMVDFVDMKDRSRPSPVSRDELRNSLRELTGAEFEVNQEENGPPTGAPINIEISGDDYQVLGRLSREIRDVIRDVPGVVDIKDDYDAERPEIQVTVDREKAALLGLTTFDIANTVRTAINGTEAAKYRVGEDEYDITVRFAQRNRRSIEDVRNINVVYEGEQIPLSTIARVETTGGVSTIQHKDMRRVITVSAKVEGRNENAALQDCVKKLAGYDLPTGYLTEFTGQNEEQEESQKFLSKAFVVALFLIAIVLISEFNSLVLPFIIMFSVILSLIGVLLGLMITGTSFGVIMTGIGVISLAGVVVKNAIVLLDYTQKLRMRGYPKNEAVIQAGLVRFRPVMLTAITTILGLIPLTTGVGYDFTKFEFQLGSESSQWWSPMGVAVIFGLGFATLLTLVYVPSMYKLLTDLTDRLGFQPDYLRKMKHVKVDEHHKGAGVVR